MDKIGVEPVALLTQIINFLLMVLILSKILYKPILKMLDERKKKIEEGLKYTAKMLKALHRETVDVSVRMAEKILKDVLSQEDQRSIIDKKLKQIASLVK